MLLAGEPLESRRLLAVVGVRDLLYVRVRFSDQQSAPETLEVSTQMTQEATSLLQAYSGNQMSFTVAIKDVVLPNPTATYPGSGGRRAIARDALAVLHSQGFDTQGFEHRCFRYSGQGKGGVANHSSTAWIMSSSTRVLAHEVGHTLGLYHSNFWNPSDNSNPFGGGSAVPYGDVFSIMGGGGVRDWNAHQKWVLGHLAGSQVLAVDTRVTGTTQITLSSHENLSSFASGDVYLVRIPFSTEALYAEYRASAGGVLIHRGDANRPSGALLLDGNPGTETASDAALKIGQSFTARYGSSANDFFRITVNSLSGAKAVIAVTVNATPAVPTSVTGIPSSGGVSLSWAAPTSTGGAAITDYMIQYSSTNGAAWTTLNDGVSATRSATVTGLTNGVSYVFRVAAMNAAGVGAYSTISAPVVPRISSGEIQNSIIPGRGHKQFQDGRLREVWGARYGVWIDLAVISSTLQESIIGGRSHIQYQNGRLREVFGTQVGEWIDLTVISSTLQESVIGGRSHIQYQNGRLREVFGTQVGEWITIRQ